MAQNQEILNEVIKTMNKTCLRGECSMTVDQHNRFMLPRMQQHNQQHADLSNIEGSEIEFVTTDNESGVNFLFVYFIRIKGGSFSRYFKGGWKNFVAAKNLELDQRLRFYWSEEIAYRLKVEVLPAEEGENQEQQPAKLW